MSKRYAKSFGETHQFSKGFTYIDKEIEDSHTKTCLMERYVSTRMFASKGMEKHECFNIFGEKRIPASLPMMASTVRRLESNFTSALTSNGNSQVPNESSKTEYNSFRDHIDFNLIVLNKKL